MNEKEAKRIPALLAARQPRAVWEEVIIEGTRMIVIIGDQVDTVIKYIRGGGVKMPQITTYKEVAESAARANLLLAKERASCCSYTTGEGHDWPRNWKLEKAKTAGKIFY